MDELKNSIRPSQIDLSCNSIGDAFYEPNSEIVARNIVILSVCNNDDKWLEFTAEEYRVRCTHDVIDAELDVLQDLVADGYLWEQFGIYTIRDSFIQGFKKK